jgi:hypothetical protein
MNDTNEFNLCAICRNYGKEECGRCEICHAYTNNFQPDESKVIINSKFKLYVHFIKCTKECGEIEKGKCGGGVYTHEKCRPVRVSLPLPKDGKCLFPNFFPYCEGIEAEGLEKIEEYSVIDDVPF